MSTTWNSAFELVPANSDAANGGADRIRTLKSAIRERFEKEHHVDLGSGTLTDDGYHLHGSAVAWYQATEPTTSPDGSALGTKDKGRIWIDSDDKNPYIYTGSAFVAMIADDADKVSAFGIGAIKDLTSVSTSLDNAAYKINGLYSVANPTYAAMTHPQLTPTFGSACLVFVQMFSDTYGFQRVYDFNATACYERVFTGSAQFGWYKAWTSITDGNGGQPPAPKPRSSAGNIGHWQYVATTLPATGTFATISFKSGLFFACDADIPGGTNMNTYYSTTGIGAVLYWRTA